MPSTKWCFLLQIGVGFGGKLKIPQKQKPQKLPHYPRTVQSFVSCWGGAELLAGASGRLSN